MIRLNFLTLHLETNKTAAANFYIYLFGTAAKKTTTNQQMFIGDPVSALALILLVYILHLLLTTTGLAETFKKDGNLV